MRIIVCLAGFIAVATALGPSVDEYERRNGFDTREPGDDWNADSLPKTFKAITHCQEDRCERACCTRDNWPTWPTVGVCEIDKLVPTEGANYLAYELRCHCRFLNDADREYERKGYDIHDPEDTKRYERAQKERAAQIGCDKYQ